MWFVKYDIFMKIVFVGACLWPDFVCATASGHHVVDYYTSQHGLQNLALVEQEIANAMASYIGVLEKRLSLAKRFLQDYKSSGLTFNSTVSTPTRSGQAANAMSITAHPLRAYRLLRRYVLDLPVIEKELRSDDERKFLKLTEKIKTQVRFPTQRDIRGAIEGILRVHDTYSINIDDFTSGKFYGLVTNTTLNAEDCFVIGRYALQATILTRAIEWLERSYVLVTHEEDKSVSSKEVRKKLEEAITKHNEAIRTGSKNPYVYNEPVSIDDALSPAKGQRTRVLDADIYISRNAEARMSDLTNFAALCGGRQFHVESKDAGSMKKCWLETKLPLLTLHPLKIERHSLHPVILQFHDLISSRTIDKILMSATVSMSRSQVHAKADQDNKVISAARTSSSTWLKDGATSTFKQLQAMYRRIEDFTALRIRPKDASEDLQVSCYGIAGHFNPHLDTVFSSVDKNFDREELAKGDRFATIMFYLSDVVRGGATVFPRTGVTVQPVKGSAIFWYNMNEEGNPDPLSLHGGCPILYGNKCVSNKWIRFNAQLSQCLPRKA